MRIRTVHINTQSDWRGGEQQTLLLVRGLLNRGHEAVLATRPESPLGQRARDLGIEIFPIRPLNEIDPRAIGRLALFLRHRRPEILHMHSPHALALGGLASRLAPGVRRVVARRVARTIYRPWTLRLNWIKYQVGAERIIAVSQAVKDVLVRDGLKPERIAVVHSGIDTLANGGPGAEDPSGPSIEETLRFAGGLPIVVSVCALDRRKGPEVLIDAAAQVLERRPAAFLLLGNGPLRAELARRLDGSPLASRVRLVGFQARVEPYLKAASLYVQPSLSEGLGTSILDALFNRVPVVASRTGGIPEIIEDGTHGLLVPPGDATRLGRAIVELLDDRDRARALGEEGRRRVLAAFSADRMVDETLEVYRRLIGA
jgi:glycosyltransferase involved in cell wall biosynthesis